MLVLGSIYYVELHAVLAKPASHASPGLQRAANFALFVSPDPWVASVFANHSWCSRSTCTTSATASSSWLTPLDRASYIILLAVLAVVRVASHARDRLNPNRQAAVFQLIFMAHRILRGMRILVIEDEPRLQVPFKRGLELKGFAVDMVHRRRRRARLGR